MIIEIKVPTPGESITEVELGKWLVEDGDVVDKDDEIAEIESDKATLTLVAEEAGKVSFKAQEGDTLDVGAVACTIDTSVQPEEKTEEVKEKPKEEKQEKEEVDEKPAKSPKQEESRKEKSKDESVAKEDQTHVKTTSADSYKHITLTKNREVKI
nr:hypothetical protein [Sunxiuqinia sp.]